MGQTERNPAGATAGPLDCALLAGERPEYSPSWAALQRLARAYRSDAVRLVGADQHAALALWAHFGHAAGAVR
jgi:hypothetical protein